MFDSSIMYFAYNNVEGDDFGVGYLGNKEWWTNIVNTWGRQDGKRHDFVMEDWEDMHTGNLRGCLLAEVVPDEQAYVVTWQDKDAENVVRINHKGEFVWEENPNKSSSIPRWMSRLKRTIKEQRN